MRNFHQWFRKTSQKANLQMWAGIGLAILATVLVYWLRSTFEKAGPTVQPLFYIFRWFAFAPLIAGTLLGARGAWTIWRLYRDPEALYIDRDGRVR